MAVYLGVSQNTSAVRTALKISWAVQEIIVPAFKNFYTTNNYTLKHVSGVDTSKVMAIRAGIRGTNDLAWIGRSANYAAKLSAKPHTSSTWITKSVYDKMNAEVKFSNGKNMWNDDGTKFGTISVYNSTYRWVLS